jgi:aminoglycoside phosphotransferase (APT) family kinase protein
MDGFPSSLRPLEGGHSGETFLAGAAAEEVVVRVYGARSRSRGPLAPEIDAAVLDLVRGLLPVPEILEVRRGDPDADLPGLLVTSLLPGERLELHRLDAEGRAAAGAAVGTLVGRLGHLAQPRAGTFADRTLVPRPPPEHRRDLPSWVEFHAERLDSSVLPGLRAVAEDAQDLVEQDRRVCLVHGDLNAGNLLVDPATRAVTGVLDWESAHLGSPYADLGNVLRFDRDPAFLDAVVAAYRGFMPATPDDLLDRARAADLFALVELAVRQEEDPVVVRARALLAAIGGTGDLHAVAV